MSATIPLDNLRETHKPVRTVSRSQRNSWLCLVALMIIFLLVAVLVGRAKPATSIAVMQNNLSVYELGELNGLTQSLGEMSFYRADLDEIKDQILALSWVDSVSVSRDWQQGIVVDVQPKKAVANFGSEYLLDANGIPFKPANKAQLNNKLANLHGDPKEAGLLMQKMQKLNAWFAPLNMVAEDVILTPRHTWLIRFNNGLRVLVDYDRVDEKLYTLSYVLADKNNHFNLKNIQAIDLRYKNGFSIAYKNR